MNTKIVYTLISDEEDIYLAQAAISAYTAKKYNPSATIELVTDHQTFGIIKSKPGLLLDFSHIVVVHTPPEFSKVQRSRFLKTTLRSHITGDFLYIDTDTVVTQDLSAIDDTRAVVAAVLDRHADISCHSYRDKIGKAIHIQGLTLDDLNDKYFNSGVVFVKDSPMAYKFYERWHKCWDESRKKGQNIDQPALARANKESDYIIEELDGIWNCQMVENFINYLPYAKILHYFASDNQSPYELYDEGVMKKVISEGVLDEDLRRKLHDTRSLFRKQHLLIYDFDLKFVRSDTHLFFSNHRKLFKMFENIIRAYLKLVN